MSKRLIACSLLALATACLASAPARAADPPTSGESDKERIERLEAKVDELTRRLEEREAREAAAPQAAPQSLAPGAGPVPDIKHENAETAVATSVPVEPNHHLELYGFVQLDAIQDFKRVNPDWAATLRPSRIPTTEGQYGSDGQTIWSVRQSRLGAKANGEIAGKPYEAKFEFDLYGVGGDAGKTTIRFRHAYARWGPILAGQTNTLLMDGDLFPNVVDYWGPPGMVFLRTPQIRFYAVDKPDWVVAMALEHATNDVDPGNIRLIDPELGTNIRNTEKLPDLSAMVRYQGDWGHLQFSGLLRKVGYDTLGSVDNKPKGSELGWGLMAAGVFKWGLATFRLGGVYGQGIASYLNDGGMDLAPKAALVVMPPIFPPPPVPTPNQLVSAKAVPLLGVTAYVDLQWSEHWSSALGYSFTQVDNTNFQDGSAYHNGEYASGNLLWSPASPILTGLEFLWGRRTDNNGNQGTDFRMQYSFKFSFSSKNLWGN